MNIPTGSQTWDESARQLAHLRAAIEDLREELAKLYLVEPDERSADRLRASVDRRLRALLADDGGAA